MLKIINQLNACFATTLETSARIYLFRELRFTRGAQPNLVIGKIARKKVIFSRSAYGRRDSLIGGLPTCF